MSTSFPEYGRYDGLGLAELIRRREVKALDVLEEAIRRIEAHNPRLNAVITKMYDQARAGLAAGLPDAPFAGVPFLVKDLLASVAGVPTSNGNRLLKGKPAKEDSELVIRWKKAGVLIVGKTNTPEFGLSPYTEPITFGPTHNPWNLERTTGGSSGGSGAAVAARLVPLASGGDGGGSIRIPASACGLFGFKPTRGRTPTGPHIGEAWHGFALEHVLTRSVRDSAAMLDATQGADIGAPYAAPPRGKPYLDELKAKPGKLRIAMTGTPLMGKHVHADVLRALERTAALLRSLGHEVVEAAPPVDGEAFSLAFITILAAELRADIEETARVSGVKVSVNDFDPASFGLGMLGKAMSAVDYARASRYLQTAARGIARFCEGYDLFLTPTLSEPPFVIGKLQPSAAEKKLIRLLGSVDGGGIMKAIGIIKPLAAQTFEFIPWTPVFNVTGQPAMSVPLEWSSDKLPVGMHFVGKFGDEATLFNLAGQLEEAKPWADAVPPGFD
jgi:amidase